MFSLDDYVINEQFRMNKACAKARFRGKCDRVAEYGSFEPGLLAPIGRGTVPPVLFELLFE